MLPFVFFVKYCWILAFKKLCKLKMKPRSSFAFNKPLHICKVIGVESGNKENFELCDHVTSVCTFNQ